MANRNMMPDVFRGERSVWNPMREMNRMQRRLDWMLDEFMWDPVSAMIRPMRDWTGIEEEITPEFDIDETETHYLINVDVPGMSKDEVQIEIRDNILMVRGERRKEEKETKERRGKRVRERYDSFTRTFTLPNFVDANKVEAIYENGVLQIMLPKSETAKPKRIQVKEGKLLTQDRETKETKSEKAA